MSARPGIPPEADNRPTDAAGSVANPHLAGILLMLAAIVLINLSDTSAKLAIDTVSVFQVALVQVLGLMACGLIAARSANLPRVMKTPDWRMLILRSACQFGAGLCYYKGLQLLPLADVIAIILLGPLATTALAALVLKEQVGPRRWAACIAGLIGAMLIIRPGMGGIGWAALWPMGCVTLYSIYVIMTRSLTATNRTSTLMCWGASVGTVVLLLAAPFYWVWPEWQIWLGLAAVAVLSGASNGLRIRALGFAPASLLAPFGYAEIVGGTILGLIVFGTFPDGWSWAGIAVIVGAGLYVWHRERRKARG
ncbi:MAG: DMT family transporter [Proteobacteria bacterium]|nr:DMT family transporter [Pseudomonadota bacterium]MDA0951694.1 DMT family transporter [Pseudomonadota bacterium]MDA1070854.1 DMT family transporter [Pseudomonadota bacterium]